jgi:hypothetical protein
VPAPFFLDGGVTDEECNKVTAALHEIDWFGDFECHDAAEGADLSIGSTRFSIELKCSSVEEWVVTPRKRRARLAACP